MAFFAIVTHGRPQVTTLIAVFNRACCVKASSVGLVVPEAICAFFAQCRRYGTISAGRGRAERIDTDAIAVKLVVCFTCGTHRSVTRAVRTVLDSAAEVGLAYIRAAIVEESLFTLVALADSTIVTLFTVLHIARGLLALERTVAEFVASLRAYCVLTFKVEQIVVVIAELA